jgi:hypothetical protein
LVVFKIIKFTKSYLSHNIKKKKPYVGEAFEEKRTVQCGCVPTNSRRICKSPGTWMGAAILQWIFQSLALVSLDPRFHLKYIRLGSRTQQ